MKVVLVTMQLGSGYRHGTERYVSNLARGLRERGHEVLCVAGDPRRPAERRRLGVPVAGEPGLLSHPSGGWMSVHGPAGHAARAWLARERPDVVHLANPAHVGIGLALAARTLGLPRVVTTMDFWWVCPRATLLREGERPCDGTPGWQTCLRCVSADHPRAGLRQLARVPETLAFLLLTIYGARAAVRGAPAADVLRWTRRRSLLAGFLRDAEHVIFPSSATRDVIRPLLGHDRWQLIPYGLEPVWLEAPRASARAPRSPEELIVGYAGSLQPHKGADVLLRALHQLGWRRTRVRLAGTSDDAAYLAALRDQARGLAVEFVGGLADDALRAFLRSLDVFVLPSRWPENLPFALLEAQAAGLPVVASRVAGVTERIPEERLLFDAGDPASLARALLRYQRQPACAAPPPPATQVGMTEATERVYAAARVARGSGA